MNHLIVKRISTRSIYKLALIGLVLGNIPLGLLFGVLAMAGMDTVMWNDQQITGPLALLVGPLMGVFIALLLTVFSGTLMAVGLWLYSKFTAIGISVIPVEKGGANQE